ncbi:MAG TPA: zf-HC2 domain-containing protein [Polyangia bacterium]
MTRPTGPASPTRHVTAERVSEWLDGDISEREAAAVRAHVATCASCADLVSELRGQGESLRELGRPEPPATLWSTIEGVMDAEDARAERGRWSWPSWLAGALGGAVTAAVAVWLVVGGRATTAGASSSLAAVDGAAAVASAGTGSDPLLVEAERELERAAASYAKAAGRLRVILDREQALWDPARRARVAERLARLDDAIVHSRAVAERDPGDGTSAEMLFSAYRRKIDFLAEVVHRGSPGAEEGLR